MKNFTKKMFTVALLFMLIKVNAQQKPHRCSTMESIEKELLTDSILKADWDEKHKDLDAYLLKHTKSRPESLDPNNPLIIPVVVHIVLPDPYVVTDQDVEYFINALNRDFSGFNSDSGNYGGFGPLRGHASFRFALAKRDPNGKSTTGIERKVSSSTIAAGNPQPIKVASTGLAPWDITKYYNLYVGKVPTTGTAAGLLGISPAIGPGRQTGNIIDGVCVNYEVFASNPCYTSTTYNLARTSVHEIGHNFGLFHTFQGGCSSADFTTQLTSTGSALPASYLNASNDDTPPLSTATYGCPSVGTMTSCTPSKELQFQNYMDYTDDACMTMFTNNQIARMEYVIEFLRPGWLTTKGHLPPDGTPLAEIGVLEMINPGGTEYNQSTCTSITYPVPTCGNPTIAPRIKIQNYGVDTIHNFTVYVEVNGTLQNSQIINTTIIPGKSLYVTGPLVNLTVGSNTLKVYTKMPNGIIDSVPSNDTLTKLITLNPPPVTSPTSLPHFEGFETTAFNPTANNWTVVNSQSGTTTWTRATNAFKTGTGCATMKMFGYTTVGDLDYLKSPKFNLNAVTDSVFLSFDYAYKTKNTGAASLKDSLSVEISTDCDNNIWTQLWKKGGVSLRTSNINATTTWTATAADWTTTPVKIYLGKSFTSDFNLAFRTKNGNGQNIYLDNINIYSVPVLPIKLAYFNVIQNEKNIICKWSTSIEENVTNFNIERSLDGRNFEAIGTTKANGNSNITSYYQFTDENAYKLYVTSLYYRLKTNDKDGKASYSSIVAVKLGEKQTLQLFPNPAKDIINVQVSNTTSITTSSRITVVDYLGRDLIQKQISLNPGTQNIDLNISSLSQGNYFVVLKTNQEVKTLKFVKE